MGFLVVVCDDLMGRACSPRSQEGWPQEPLLTGGFRVFSMLTAVSGAPSDAGRSLSESWLTRPFISGGHLAVAVAPCGAQGLGSSTWKGAREPLTAVSARPLGDQYALKMRLVDHVFDEQVIDSLTVKIILPEGAK